MMHLTELGQRIRMIRAIWLHRDDPVLAGEKATCVLLHPDTHEAVLRFDQHHHSLNEYGNELSIFPPGHMYCFGEWTNAFEILAGEVAPVAILNSVEDYIRNLKTKKVRGVLTFPHSSGFGAAAVLCTASMLHGLGVWALMMLPH